MFKSELVHSREALASVVFPDVVPWRKFCHWFLFTLDKNSIFCSHRSLSLFSKGSPATPLILLVADEVGCFWLVFFGKKEQIFKYL